VEEGRWRRWWGTLERVLWFWLFQWALVRASEALGYSGVQEKAFIFFYDGQNES
jgi:hypothetical protein